MILNLRSVICTGVVLLGCGAIAPARAGEKLSADDKTVMQLGIPESLFQGIPEVIRRTGASPFLKMLRTHTGLEGNIHFAPDSMSLARDIDSGKIHVGIFQGHEFAWAQEKYGKLVPIAITNPLVQNQAYCIVRWDSKATNIGDLKGDKISLPPIHRDYCEMFLSKNKAEYMKGSTFTGQLASATATDAIQEVIDQKSGCTVVDGSTLKFFETVYPGQFKNLKILCHSDPLPNACVVVKQGELDEKTIEKIRKALFNAPNDPVGRPMMTTWKLKGFEKVPDDYPLQLQKVLKNYPTPPAVRAAIDK